MMYEICKYLLPEEIINTYLAYDKPIPIIITKQMKENMVKRKSMIEARYTINCKMCGNKMELNFMRIWVEMESTICEVCGVGWDHRLIEPYITIINGLDPYHVYVEGNRAHIYHPNMTRGGRELIYRYFMSYDVEHVFVGKNRNEKYMIYEGAEKYNYVGNTVLLKRTGNNYVFIGHKIYEFATSESIEKYYSWVGKNDIPYPVAISKTYAYFMLDGVYVRKDRFTSDVDWRYSYYQYYGYYGDIKKKNGVKIKKLKECR